MSPHNRPLCTIAYVEDSQEEADRFIRRCQEIGIDNPIRVFRTARELEDEWPDDIGALLVDLVLLSGDNFRQKQGLEIVEWARNRDAHLPIMVVTKTNEEIVEANAIRVGATALVTKPINMLKLEEELRKAGMGMGLYRKPRPADDEQAAVQ